MELRLLCYAVAVLLTIFPRLRMTQGKFKYGKFNFTGIQTDWMYMKGCF